MIDPRITSPAIEKYNILTTFDIPLINAKLNTDYHTLAEVSRDSFDLYFSLSDIERRQVDKETDLQLRRIPKCR